MSFDKFKKLLHKDYIIMDGAMGTMLQKNGLEPGYIPEFLNLNRKDMIINIHKSYIQSGSDIICANTFGANRFKLDGSEYTLDQVITAAIENAGAARAEENSECMIALDIGPLGKLLEPSGELTFDEAYDSFREIIIHGENAGADIILIETMTDLFEAKAALLAAKENSRLPVICTMSFEENMRTFTGTDIASAALTLEGLGTDAIGINCSLGPDRIYPIIKELIEYTSLPVVVKPNAGLPDPITNQYNILPEEFAEHMSKLVPLGVKFFGGCCGSTPEYISQLSLKLSSCIFTKNYKTDMHPLPESSLSSPCICSSRKTVKIDMPRIIGERINPTGKKLFKEALRCRNINYIIDQALEQVNAGAEILDVNVGLPEIDEKEMMVTVIKALQGVVDVPLQIDSTNPEVLEAALRIYCGKPIINSVNGEEESMNRVLPLVKKYGAAVVCLTLDERGIPATAEQRLEIAKRIMKRAVSIGIPKKDIFIDCLTLTASAQQEGVMETLKAVKMVKEELGLKTVLGVSNISFGLPEREMINQSFLAMALTYGLDLPILNPNIGAMTGTVHAYRVLANIDKNSVGYISNYTKENRSYPNKTIDRDYSENRLMYAIENGLAEEGAEITVEMLKSTDSLEIIDNYLIPALDSTGQKYESGKIFLPQLIMSANAAQACFSVIKEKLSANSEGAGVSKGKIILATVKGDIHDIGKNIVKILLENYGYEIIDLGKDVDPQIIANTAAKEEVTLVGLSALMTTTLKSMEETITILRNQGNCSVMVGGAVLTAEYAERIGADYYEKNAKGAVDIAKKHFGS